MPFLRNHTSQDLLVPELAFYHLPQLILAGEQVEITDALVERFAGHPNFDIVGGPPPALPDPPVVDPPAAPPIVVDPPAAPPIAPETAVTVDVPAGQHVELVPDTQGAVSQ